MRLNTLTTVQRMRMETHKHLIVPKPRIKRKKRAKGLSAELNEDSIIPILPVIREQMMRAINEVL